MLSAPPRTRAEIAADAAQTRRHNTAARHLRVVSRIHQLFNGKRLRLDDAYQQVAAEFGLAQATVERIHVRLTANTPGAAA